MARCVGACNSARRTRGAGCRIVFESSTTRTQLSPTVAIWTANRPVRYIWRRLDTRQTGSPLPTTRAFRGPKPTRRRWKGSLSTIRSRRAGSIPSLESACLASRMSRVWCPLIASAYRACLASISSCRTSPSGYTPSVASRTGTGLCSACTLKCDSDVVSAYGVTFVSKSLLVHSNRLQAIGVCWATAHSVSTSSSRSQCSR